MTPIPTRLDRDGRVTLASPLTRPNPVVDLLAGLAIIGAILVVVGWVAGDGFAVSVPVQIEEDDGPSSEVMP